MTNLEFSIDTVSTAEQLAALTKLLNAHNESRGFTWAPESLAIYAYDSENRTVGGITATTNFGWLHINILAVDEGLRGSGCGSLLVKMAEEAALTRGCHAAYLDTFSFQALEFYQKCGYEIYGVLDDFPPGQRRYFLKKVLRSLHQ